MSAVTTSSERVEIRGEVLFGLMMTGVIVLTALIAFMGVVGQWWLLALTFTTLVATTGLVVFAIERFLDQPGD